MSDEQQGRYENPIEWNSFIRDYYNIAAFIGKAEESNKLYNQLTASIGKLDFQLEEDKAIINRCTQLYKIVKASLKEKKDKSLEEYNKNIRITNAMIPDANLEDVSLKIMDNRAAIVNSDGQSINIREGGAARSVLGSLMRVTSVKAINGAIPFILFDESFFSLSENTTVQMREVLEELSKQVLIIGIEQKDLIFQGIEGLIVYNFTKTEEGYTIVQRR